MMTRTDKRRFPIIIAALAGLALAVGLFVTHVPQAHAQDATITSLLSRLDVGVLDAVVAGTPTRVAGYKPATPGDRIPIWKPQSRGIQLPGRVRPLVHG